MLCCLRQQARQYEAGTTTRFNMCIHVSLRIQEKIPISMERANKCAHEFFRREAYGGSEPQSFVIFSYRYLAAHESAPITASFLPGLLWVLK